MKNPFKYLIYDIETVVNKPLLNKVLYPGEGLSDDEAHRKCLAELEPERNGFINPSFHKPVTIGAVAVAEDFTITKINVLGGEERTTSSIVTHFWEIYNSKHPTLVDFNGKGFDMRILELWAFQLGIPIHGRHFARNGTRYRFADDQHCDLHDFLTNYGAIRYKGGLNLFSKLLGKPGKMDTKGDMVQELFDAGNRFQIDDYCLCDVMDTYFVFLRTRVMLGQLTLPAEKELVEKARELLEEKYRLEGYFKQYLDNFGEWVPEK